MDTPVVILSVLVAVLYRWSISLFPYSGYRKPPMHGDFEAQRHWMEITYNLPVDEWYMNSSRNDLQYWGLDYPPLTAYHSYIMGYIASNINSSWVALNTSRGLETPSHKLFMRYSALVSEIFFVPFVIAYFQLAKPVDSRIRCLFCFLLYPGLALIDHGHFQYNMISLGLTLLAVVCLTKHHDLLGSVAFSLALNYKQMELYHALPFFCYLLGSSLKLGKFKCIVKLMSLAAVVIATFLVCWYPFLWEREQFLQVLHRLFPFARGLFEDKVANFWCCFSILVKVKQKFDLTALTRYSFIATLLGLAPMSIDLVRRPTIKRFKLALMNSALVFYLFSFQVHEKSILLAALPACLLLPDYPLSSAWFLLISTFSMYPLLLKDGLAVPFFCCQLIFFLITCGQQPQKAAVREVPVLRGIMMFLFYLSTLGGALLCLAHYTVPPPARYPDLFPVINSLYCFLHFLVFLSYHHFLQWTLVEVDAKSPTQKSVRYGRGRTPKKEL